MCQAGTGETCDSDTESAYCTVSVDGFGGLTVTHTLILFDATVQSTWPFYDLHFCPKCGRDLRI